MDHHALTISEKERENQAIHHILLRILEKWRTGLEQRDEELEKTVVLSTARATRQERPSSFQPVEEREETLAETIILPPKEGKPGPSSPREKPKGTEPISKLDEPQEKDEFLEETVILKPKKA